MSELFIKNRMRSAIKSAIVLALCAVTLGAVVVVAEFSQPNAVPVSNDVETVHVGAASQTKAGGVWVDALSTANPAGKLCIGSDTNCKTSWRTVQTFGQCHLESATVMSATILPAGWSDVRTLPCDTMLTPESKALGWVSSGSNLFNQTSGGNSGGPSTCYFIRLVCPSGVTVLPSTGDVDTIPQWPIRDFSISTNQCSNGLSDEAVTFTKLSSNFDTLPSGMGVGVAFSPDGLYLAVANGGATPLNIYKRPNTSSTAFTKLPNPTSMPAGNGLSVDFSSDGQYLAVGTDGSSLIYIYKRSGDTFTKLTPDPDILPTGQARGVAFSADTGYLAVAHPNSPFVTIYKRSGDTFTKLSNPSTLPTGNGGAVDFSPDGEHLAVGHATTPFITIYQRSGDTFTKVPNPVNLPTGNVWGVAFHPESNYVVAAHESPPYVTLYRRSENVFKKQLYTMNGDPTGSGLAAAFSPNGTILSVPNAATPFVRTYMKEVKNYLYRYAVPAAAGTGYGVAFSPDSSLMAVAHNTSPYITTYTVSDSLVDTADPQCGSWYDQSETTVNVCSDGINNDGDGFTDYPDDTGCTAWNDATE